MKETRNTREAHATSPFSNGQAIQVDGPFEIILSHSPLQLAAALTTEASPLLGLAPIATRFVGQNACVRPRQSARGLGSGMRAG